MRGNLIFFTQTQSLKNTLSNFTTTVNQSSFLKAYWQAVQVVWGLDKDLINRLCVTVPFVGI